MPNLATARRVIAVHEHLKSAGLPPDIETGARLRNMLANARVPADPAIETGKGLRAILDAQRYPMPPDIETGAGTRAIMRGANNSLSSRARRLARIFLGRR